MSFYSRFSVFGFEFGCSQVKPPLFFYLLPPSRPCSPILCVYVCMTSSPVRFDLEFNGTLTLPDFFVDFDFGIFDWRGLLITFAPLNFGFGEGGQGEEGVWSLEFRSLDDRVLSFLVLELLTCLLD